MRWLAFYGVKGDVEEYSMHEENLKKLKVTLEDWMRMDEKTREFKLKNAREMDL